MARRHRRAQQRKKPKRASRAAPARANVTKSGSDRARALCRQAEGHLAAGGLAAAEAALGEAARLAPGLAQAHAALGAVLLQRGDPSGAEASCRRALELAPRSASCLYNLGIALYNQRRFDEAASAYRQARQLDPEHGPTHNNLGNALKAMGKTQEAVACYERALELNPHSLPALLSMGSTLIDLRRVGAARRCFERALSLDPSCATALQGLGAVLSQEHDTRQAEAMLRQALEARPTDLEARINLGRILEQRGDLAQARACYEDALAIAPGAAAAWVRLGHLLGADLPPAAEARMRQLIADPAGLDQRDLANLHFCLAQVCDARADYDVASRHMQQANALQADRQQQRGKSYDPDSHARGIDELIAVFDEAYFRRVQGWGNDTQRPIFVVGFPRSGTTLVEQILASHPAVFGAGELEAIQDSVAALGGPKPGQSQVGALAGRIDAGVVRERASVYLALLQRLDAHAERVVDKLPGNYLWLGWIRTLFPQAAIIHTHRHPLDTALSCYMTEFRDITWANDLDHIARRYGEYQRLMAHWRAVLPGTMYEVLYRDLVRSPEEQIPALVAACGLPWAPTCLAPHESRRTVQTASIVQARQPIYTGSVDRRLHYRKLLAGVADRLGAE